MNCCIDCFNDNYIITYIKSNGETKDCNFCGSNDIKCMRIERLRKLFSELIDLYIPSAELVKKENRVSKRLSASLAELLQKEWKIFNNDLSIEKQNSILNSILKDSDYDASKKWIDFKYNMLLNSGVGYWGMLEEKLKYGKRFIFDKTDDNLEKIFNLLNKSLLLTEEILSENTEFYRARKGCKKENNNLIDRFSPYEKMGSPPKYKTKSGRANPPGISFIYLATDKETALSEVRPWKGAKVSIAKFILNIDLKVIDLTDINIGSPFQYKGDLKEEIEKRYLLQKLDCKLKEPINPDHSDIEYVPTQFITEFIRSENYDGIIYDSAMGPGKNIVLFNDVNVDKDSTNLFEVKNISYGFDEYKK